jgi:cytochrome c oxidase subunit 3
VPEATAHAGPLGHQFESLEQQQRSATLGMWAFLLQELMFFGGLFTVYVIYDRLHHPAFVEGSRHLDVALGTFNTAVLILSSLTMALAVRAAQLGRATRIAALIGATMLLASAFLVVKVVEYSHKFHDGLVPGLAWHPEPGLHPAAAVFFGLYFVMTGVHALHMVVGLGLMVAVALRALRGRYSSQNSIGVEMLGLYWHFVDLVWIFLFPLLYLLGRHA